MGVGQASVPAIVATGIVCLALGAGAGAVGMKVYQTFKSDAAAPSATDTTAPGGNANGMPGGGMPGGGMRGNRGGGGPPVKFQLVGIVTRLDLLTSKQLVLSLSDDQRAKLSEQLKTLDADELSDDDAKKHLEAIQEIVKDNKATMDAAGGLGGGGGRGMGRGNQADQPSNPFKAGTAATHLKGLQDYAGKAKGS